MKIRFAANWDLRNEELIAEFDVAEPPTDEQCEAIMEDINNAMDAWEEEFEDFTDFDYQGVCHDACVKHIKLIDNPVIKTFYI